MAAALVHNFAEKLRTEWKLPALSIAIVNGEESVAKVFGEDARIGKYDEHTLFPVMSCSKLFTAVAVGILVDQGKLTFDSKIQDLIPGFSMQDKVCEAQLTPRLALSHRSGFDMRIIRGYHDRASASDVLDIIAAGPASPPVDTLAVYNNHMYTLMGYLVEIISGQPYPDFVAENILRPLGMLETTFDTDLLEARGIPASLLIDQKRFDFKWGHAECRKLIESCGGLFITCSDAAKWLDYLIRQSACQPEGVTLLRRATFAEITRGTSLIDWTLGFGNEPGKSAFVETSPPLYALGNASFHYRGIKVISHMGSMPGGCSLNLWAPDRKFGIALSANVNDEGTFVISALACKAMDVYFGLSDIAWEQRTASLCGYFTLPYTVPVMPAARTESKPTLAREQLIGTYVSSAYGQFEIGLPGWRPNVKTLSELKTKLDKADEIGSSSKQPLLVGCFRQPSLLFSYWKIYHYAGDVYVCETRMLAPKFGSDRMLDLPPDSTLFTLMGFRVENGQVYMAYNIKMEAEDWARQGLVNSLTDFKKLV